MSTVDDAPSGVPIEILLVEDDPGDVLITREAFAEHKVSNRLTVCTDGADALRFLRREGAYVGAARPDIVLLDLNLPGIDGRAVLAAIHADPALNDIPVVVLTSSRTEQDYLRSRELRVDTYITKPVDFDSLMHVVRRIETFFISVRRAATA
ncbi:response regulator [Dactylosporangium aurantiacum]|uniref:Response regulator n=1 Tax=Dactylosporangium aurantiacum TaxID=35754 RepID=A0A9Q9IJM8_9ACTN|nr:response regulator [Dactylosporangium aurantiacum]MDG6108433.1 response regulator [Dactylosporangium aurantiacum]UWZ57374.1 response regulator [Dactylosporangium aurantiacum]